MEPSGRWSNPSDTAAAGGITPATDDNDDIIEIGEPTSVGIKQEPPTPDRGLQRTPAFSLEPPKSSPANPSSSNKRPAAQVIDLTGSDDEDGSPVPAKRRALDPFHCPYSGRHLNGIWNQLGPGSSGHSSEYNA